MSLTLSSHAKINFFLQVLGKRPDGFHAVRTLMLPIGLTDTLTFQSSSSKDLVLTCSDPTLKTDSSNLVWKAADLLRRKYAPKKGVRIHIEKNIPLGAGLGGGSSNGSTTLVGLNRFWDLELDEGTLENLAAEFGSDTAFFVRNQPALSEGRGEILTPIHFTVSFEVVLLNFGFGSATGWAYKHLQISNQKSKTGMERIFEGLEESSPSSILESPWALQNDLETPVFNKFPILRIAKEFLLQQKGVLGAMMCGSGSTMMAVVKSEGDGKHLKQRIKDHFGPGIWIWSGTTLAS